MANVTNKDIPEEFNAFGDFFVFRKKYYNGEDKDDFWMELIDAADELSRKYKSRFFDQLILVCVDDIDRRYMTSINKPWKSDPLEQVYERLQRNRGKKT